MKAHRYFAILVFVASAIWVLTGDFSFVGSAVSDDEPANTVAARVAEEETNQKVAQTVGYAVIPNISHARTINISGVTEADKTTQLTARANGIIGELLVSQGDLVKEGDIILRLAPEGRDAAVASAEQLVAQRKAETVAREKLVEQGTLPKLQLDQVMSALRTAESQLEAAKAELEKLEVIAPFDGVIDVLDVERGGSVQPGAPVATLISLDPIIGRGEINESDLGTITVGSKAQLRLVNGAVVDGVVRYISRQASTATRTYGVEVEVPNPDLAVPSGMTAEVQLRGREVSATPVPRSIVTLNNNGELGVRAVDEDDKVVFYPIDIVDDSTGALILGGIPENSRIIVLGQNFVADGQKVDPVEGDKEALEKLLEEVQQDLVVQ